jgi:hypothetical protein
VARRYPTLVVEGHLTINVFLSVGRAFSDIQESFISSIERHLEQSGLRPRTVGRNEFSYKQPLQLVDDLMERSAGALVIALERLSIETGFERRGTPAQTVVTNIAIPTPWNQIEAAFAYAKRIPLLVIRENKVRPEGLLEGRYDWYVHATDLDASFLTSAEFKGTFDSWYRDVRRRAGWFRYRR